MTPVLSYLLKANIVLIALYGFYFLCFRRDTFFVHIRWYLMITIVSAVTFPLTDISAWLTGSQAALEAAQYIPDIEAVYQYVLAQSQIVLSYPPQIEYADEPVVVARMVPFGVILLWCWLPVAIFMIVKRLFQLVCIARLWRRYPRQRHVNSAIVAVDRNIQPFSFFSRIFLNPALYSQDELDEILVHEQVHCRKRHTIDILLAEALVCFCWFNPAAWLLRRDLKQNLEFYTDRITLRSGFNRKHYQYSLLRVSGNAFQIVNHFHFSHFYFNHLKKRIIMLNKKESPRIAAVKYLLVIPALAATFLAVQASGLQVNEPDDINVVDMNPVLTEVAILSIGESNGSNHPSDETVKKDIVNIPDLSVEQEPVKTETTSDYRIRQGTAYVSEGNKISVSDDDKVLVSGTVMNLSDGKTMPGVNVTVIGMTTGTVTDMNGKYSIAAPANTTLQFSFPGMSTTREVAAGNQQIIDVVMDAETYSRVEEEKVTSAIPTFRIRGIGNEPLYIVDGKEVENLNNISANDVKSISLLKNASAISYYGEKGKNGVIIVTTKKNANATQTVIPGTFDYNEPQTEEKVTNAISTLRVRGTGGNEPLYIVDGKEIEAGSLGNISPNDIESIEVLKNGSAISHYGEKGKNGVIIVTTKK